MPSRAHEHVVRENEGESPGRTKMCVQEDASGPLKARRANPLSDSLSYLPVILKNAVLCQCASLGIVFLHFLIEPDQRSLHIRSEPEIAYSKSEDAQDAPANKGEVKPQQVHLVAIHHLHAEFDSLVVLHLGIIVQDEAGHGIGKSLDDTGDNE